MKVIAKTKYVRISARKMRLVASLIRGLSVEEAVIILTHLHKSSAEPMLLTLKQGMGNAINNFGLLKESLKISSLEIGEGPTYKRGRPVSRGKWHPILKRTCHISLTLEGKTKVKKIIKNKKKNGTKS